METQPTNLIPQTKSNGVFWSQGFFVQNLLHNIAKPCNWDVYSRSCCWLANFWRLLWLIRFQHCFEHVKEKKSHLASTLLPHTQGHIFEAGRWLRNRTRESASHSCYTLWKTKGWLWYTIHARISTYVRLNIERNIERLKVILKGESIIHSVSIF